MSSNVSKNKWAIVGLVIGITLMVGASASYLLSSAVQEPVDWNVTVVGSNGEQKVITYEQITKMPYQEAKGGYLTSAGLVYGPYKVKGVLLQDLCDQVGGITANNYVSITAPDGYSMTFGHDQIYNGDFLTWDPETLHEVPHEHQMILLTYEWDGKPISNNDGGPLRLVIVSDGSFLTEGHNWVMWVNKIEVETLK
jgi:DMSO/TMAO reductase YedYZ molybdopterin-dependent catalytic subunit